jgi:hypothetical protein
LVASEHWNDTLPGSAPAARSTLHT